MRLSIRRLVILALIALGVFLGSRVAPTHAQQNSCLAGDANGDGKVTIADFVTWRQAFLGKTLSPTPPPSGEHMLGGSNNPNDHTAYPEMLPPPGPRAIPPGGVAIAAGQNIQAAIDSHAAGTQFNLAEGTWHGGNGQISPKAGDSFYGVGAGRTILSGYTIRAHVANVTIANLTIRDFTGDDHGAIESNFDAGEQPGWKIQNVESAYNNHGFAVGKSSLVEHVLTHHNNINGGAGGGGGHVDGSGNFACETPAPQGSIFRYNAFIFNNRAGAPDDNASHANSKSGNVCYSEWYGNYFADGGQPGYWCDVGCGQNKWHDNISVRNSAGGIMDEINSGGNVIENNITIGNGWRNFDWQDVGILISSSRNDIVRNNISLRNVSGSIVLWCDRTRGNQCGNSQVYGNTIDTDVYNNSDPNTAIHDNTVKPADQVQVPRKAVGPQM